MFIFLPPWLWPWGFGISSDTTTISLHPIGVNLNKFTLPGPMIGDTIRLIGKGKINRSRNLTINEIQGYGREGHDFILTFNRLTNDEADDLLTFLETVAGYPLDYIDIRDNIWRCFITNPDASIVKHGNENNGITLELVGR